MGGAIASEDEVTRRAVDEVNQRAAPRIRRVAAAVQQTAGTTDIDTDGNRVGIFVLTLRANNTGVNMIGDPAPGTLLVLAIRQGVGAPWTWTPAANMRFAGGDFGPTSTVQNHRDIYTMIYDGNDWNETARALGVR
jgi:hypothetical protein